MSTSTKHFRVPISVLVALSVTITFTLSSFAASNVDNKTNALPTERAGTRSLQTGERAQPLSALTLQDVTEADAQVQSGQTGTLTAKGPVTVNGNAAKTGMTILTQSAITTGSGAEAFIELGPLGRIVLDSETSVTLQMLGNVVEATLTECGKVTITVPAGITGRVPLPQPQKAQVKVIQGKVTVKYEGNKEKVLVAGQNKDVDDLALATSDGTPALFEVHCHHHRPVGYYFLASPLALLFLLLRGGEEQAVAPVLSPVIPG